MNTLQVSAQSPWLVHAGAATILFLHIAGGTVGMLSGTLALALRKGGRRHAVAGNVFFGSMMVMALVGASVAPFLRTAHGDPKLFDSLAGFLTFYLVATGWMTVKRKAGTIGRFEVAAFVFVSVLAATAILLGAGAGAGGTGYFGFAAIMALAAAFDLKVILSSGIAGPPRIARHLWRMCTALFVALGSFFFGQQRMMPGFVQGALWLDLPPLIPLATMLLWLLRLRFARAVARFGQALRTLRRPAAETRA